jgi:hypothetical protein
MDAGPPRRRPRRTGPWSQTLPGALTTPWAPRPLVCSCAGMRPPVGMAVGFPALELVVRNSYAASEEAESAGDAVSAHAVDRHIAGADLT